MFSHNFVDASQLSLIALPVIQRFSDPSHHDRCAHYSHELSDDAAEASTRFLIRAVPAVYGVFLGIVGKHPVLGTIAGVLVTTLLDLRMGDSSLSRPLFAPWIDRIRPRVVRSVARSKAWGRRHGLVPRRGYDLG